MKTADRALTIAGVVCVVLLAVALTAWIVQVRGSSVYTDAQTIRVPVSDAPLRSVLWQPAAPLPGSAGSDADEYEPRLSADATLMIFVRGKPGANADLFTRRWTPDGWTAPEPLAPLNTDADELGPELSRDGRTLYFYSDRAGGSGGYDLWGAQREGGQWAAPVNLGAAVNTPFNEYGPALTPAGDTLYFSSNRPRPGEPERQRDPWPATVRETRDRHDYDLYAAPMREGEFSPAAPVTELNTAFDEGAPAVSPPGDFLYFASDRPGGNGGFDLFRARRLESKHQTLENLGPAVNSSFNDLDPALSADGFRLLFSSDRPEEATDPSGPAPERRPYSLWSTASREVFIDWSAGNPLQALMGLLSAVWPWLLLLLLSLLLLLLLLRALSDPRLHGRLRRLSLLAQCLLLSLLIHALLASLLAVWRVGSEIGEYLRRSGGTRVILSSAAESDAASAQLLASGASAEPLELAALTAPALNEVSAALEMTPVALEPVPLPEWVDTSRAEIQPEAPDAPATTTTPDPVAPDLALPAHAAPAALPSEPAPAPSRPEPSAARTPTMLAALDAPPPLSVEAVLTAPAPAALPVPRAPAPPERARLDFRPTEPAPGAPAPPPARNAAELPAIPAPTSARTPAEVRPARAEPSIEPGASPPPIESLALTPSPPPLEPAPAVVRAPMVEAAPMPIRAEDTARLIVDRAPAHDAPAPDAPRPPIASAPLPTVAAPDASAARTPSEQRPEQHPSRAPEPAAPRVALVELNAPAPSLASAIPALEVPRLEALAPTVSSGAPEPAPVLDLIPRAPSPAPAQTPMASSPPPSVPALSPLAPRAPADEPLPEPVETFDQRAPEVRSEMLERAGGSAETERAVGRALEWLTRHQMPDGSWSGHRFDERCGGCGGEAEVECDAAMTAVSLLCFLGAGHTPAQDGPYRAGVARAIDWLIARQDASGDLRRGETMYSQTIAAVALCEAFSMTRDERIGRAARRAVSFMLSPRNSPRNSARALDTSVLGWQVMAVEAARRSGFSVPDDALEPARRWLESTSAVRPGAGRYAHHRGEAPSAAMTAEAMFVQQLLGRPREEPRMEESASFILETLPDWDAGAPTYYWYYATLALFQHQGEAWTRWNERLVPALLGSQRTEGPAAGSWDPQDYWSRLGGRLYQTAVCTLSLEVYYRYRVQTAPSEPGRGP